MRGGQVDLASCETLHCVDFAIFDPERDSIAITTIADRRLLPLDGTPIHELVVARVPFVMNRETEIEQASDDDRHSRMGRFNSPSEPRHASQPPDS